MSNIFRALKKTPGEAADISLPLIAKSGNAAAAAPAPDGAPPKNAGMVLDKPPFSVPTGSVRQIPIRVGVSDPVLPYDDEHSHAAEQYRIIRTKILQHPAKPKVIVVSSACPQDGKTISSINIAGALALKPDVHVLLLDAELRRSSVAPLLGIDPTPGLSEVLCGQATLEEAVIQVEQAPNLYVLPAGRAEANPAEMLDSAYWRSICETFRNQFDCTIIDAPPLSGLTDYDLIQVVCDGVVLVARPDHTNRTSFLAALEAVPHEKLLGVLFNGAPRPFPWSKLLAYDYYPKEKNRASSRG